MNFWLATQQKPRFWIHFCERIRYNFYFTTVDALCPQTPWQLFFSRISRNFSWIWTFSASKYCGNTWNILEVCLPSLTLLSRHTLSSLSCPFSASLALSPSTSQHTFRPFSPHFSWRFLAIFWLEIKEIEDRRVVWSFCRNLSEKWVENWRNCVTFGKNSKNRFFASFSKKIKFKWVKLTQIRKNH